jgi:hypothetical protein
MSKQNKSLASWFLSCKCYIVTATVSESCEWSNNNNHMYSINFQNKINQEQSTNSWIAKTFEKGKIDGYNAKEKKMFCEVPPGSKGKIEIESKIDRVESIIAEL